MKFTIFTGIHKGERFFDSFAEYCIDWDEYPDCKRFDFTLDESEIETRIKDLLADEECFKTCCSGMSRIDIDKFIHKAYQGDVDRELINDYVQGNARKMVIDLWEQDCMDEVKRKFKEDR